MKFQKNCWYVAAYPREISRSLFNRTIAGEKILMFRREDGGIAAMESLCPHRFAPLDRGTLDGDTVTCKYHGLRFGADGRCVHNPHADRVTRRMDLAHFPAVERHGLVWVWPGNETSADPATIPNMSRFEDGPDRRTVHSYLYAPYRYDILIDNLMDLSHADYLHVGSFTAGAGEKTELIVREENDGVIVTRTCYRSPPPPITRFREGAVDVRTVIHWHPGQVILFESRTAPSGADFQPSEDVEFFHIGTPADPDHTHYFMGGLRVGTEDEQADAALRMLQRGVIENEDGPMLEAVHASMAGRELIEMHPLILPVDAGAMRVRRKMKQFLDEESEPADDQAATA